MIKLTENAAQDNITNEGYIKICDELKGSMSWDRFIEQIGSTKNKSQWSEWRKGERNLLWEMKNDLRDAVDLPILPIPVMRVIEQNVCPNALIETDIFDDVVQGKGTYVYIGKEKPDKPTHQEVLDDFIVKLKHKRRIGVMRPSHVPTRYDEQRKKLGKSWIEVIEAGLVSIERGDVDGKAGKGGRLK